MEMTEAMIGSKTGEISKIDVKDVVEHVHDEKISREVMTSSAAIFLPPSFSSSPNRADLEIRSRSSRKRRRFGVSVSNLSVKGSIQSSNQQSTFVNTGLLRSLSSLWRKTTDSTSSSCILNNVDGVVKKGEMLMVLGQPGSGCSTLLKVLSGELHGLKIAEATQLHYEGIPDQDIPRLRQTVQCTYLAEIDVHFPELTVNETLDFAATVSSSDDGETILDNNHLSRDTVVSAFDLDKPRNTFVGDHIIPGISGGEKIRTSLAEIFLSDASLQCWDNCTRGLDSTTALKIMELLRKTTTDQELSVVTSVYQASKAMCEVFDKVTLLHKGFQIYFGTFDGARKYFEDLGFVCPPAMSIAEFLLSVTNLEKRVVRPSHQRSVPTTIEDFVGTWRSSTDYLRLRGEIEAFDQTTSQEITISDGTSPMSTPLGRQISICIKRGFQRLKNNIIPPISGIVGQTIVGIILGTIFYNLPTSSSGILPRDVLLFYAVMINACSSAFEVLTMWAQRPIVEKQARYNFYRPFIEATASMICDLPNKLLTTIFFNTVLYFMTGLRRSADAFFTYLLFAFVCLITMSMFFRMIGSMSRNLEQTMAPVAILILNFLIYAGFVIPPRYMHPWLGWIRFINPIAYAYESLMINEVWTLAFSCDQYIPSGPEYINATVRELSCAVPGSELDMNNAIQGSAYIENVYGYSRIHLWRNLGILVAMAVCFCAVHLITTEYVSSSRSAGQVLCWLPGTQNQMTEKKTDSLPTHESLDIERHSKVFTWSDLSYTISKGKGKQTHQILQDIDGWIRPQQLTAVMGTTGAGKTTLLNILADRVDARNVRGEILLNGMPRDTDFQAGTGYVQQTDTHHANSTVREALIFCALLRQSNIYSREAKLKYVDTVIKTLAMESYADAMILTPGESLNTEQRRRLTIALELVARPELLLFLDEPTSGLDSETAWSICTLLRELADAGQSVLCTIHQPSASLFNMFDKLLLLGPVGRTVYFGPTGKAVIDYFESRGALACGPDTNPAEWLLDITNSLTNKDGETWTDLWQASEEKMHVKDALNALNSGTASNEKQSSQDTSFCLSRSPFLVQLRLVTHRRLLDYWRSPSYLYSKICLCVGAALFNGLSFYSTPNTLQGLQNALFSIFLMTVIFSNIDQQIIPRLMSSRALFEARERASQTYSWIAFIAAEIIVEAIWQTLVSVLVFAAWYFPSGMWRNAGTATMMDERSMLVFLFVWTFCLFCSTFSHAVAVAIQHAETAVNIAQLFFYLCLIFCGVIVQGSALPRFWTFMYHVSPLTYLIAGIAAAGLAGAPIECATEELLRFLPPTNVSCEIYMQPYISYAGGKLVQSGIDAAKCQYCPLSTNDEFLNNYAMYYDQRWRNLGLQFVYLAFNVAATFGLYWLCRERTKSGR